MRLPRSSRVPLFPRLLAGLAGGALALSSAAAAPRPQAQPPTPSPAPASKPVPQPLRDGPPIIPGLEAYENRLIRAVELRGFVATDEQLIRNSIRSLQGRPLNAARVAEDVRILTRLGRFKEVEARVQAYDDNTVALIYIVVEAPIIKDVQVSGNNEITDRELGDVVAILANTPVDRFQLDRTLRGIENLYRSKGYYQVNVTVDEKELADNGILLFIIREGERLSITDITFEGNVVFPGDKLRPEIKTETKGLFRSGVLNDATVDQDVATIVKFYKDRGYLDVRVDRRIQPAPNGKEAALTFLVEEGPRYTLRAIKIELVPSGDEKKPIRPGDGPSPVIISREQAIGLITIRPGDVYGIDKITKSVEALKDAYGQMGYVDATVTRADLRDPSAPVVDLYLQVFEGQPVRTGLVLIDGNNLTKQSVIRREIQVQPGRPLDITAIRDTERRLAEINLFAGAREGRPPPRLTVQPPDPDNPGVRDVLLQLEDKNTGSLTFGVAAGSDGGVIGQIALRQDNFDLYDTPDSFSEFITGKAFRGAGQRFEISISPGTEVSNYSIGLSDPAVFDSEYSAGGNVYYRQRAYNEYDESRYGLNLNLGRRFGQRWQGRVGVRAESIDITNIDSDSLTDLFDVEGASTLSSFSTSLIRTAVDSRVRPTTGTRLELGVERVGLLGGDYDFSRLSAEYQVYFTVGEDYLGRKSVLGIKTFGTYIPEGNDDTPIFERVYLGGRSFRGFAFRGVSPRGERFAPPGGPPTPASTTEPSNDPSGGSWAFFLGAELERPIFEKTISYVLFVDSGTVTDQIGFSDYRISAGFGLRFNFPGLGPAPLAFDFGFPIASQENDQERVFSFSIDIPF